MKVYAPGKLILSGEHAVVYGAPALAMAVNRYASATVTRELLPQISFHLADLAHRSRLTLNGLHHLKERIKRKYQRFVRGEYTIRQVLQKPFELAHLALGIFTEALNLSLPHGVKIHVESSIPMGCGMGSSAATIVCVMQAISEYLNVPLSSDTLFQLALEAENMQHGRSSGLDLRMAIQGGCIYLQGQAMQVRQLPTQTFFLVNTGTPETSTGQCVHHVASLFQSQSLCSEFTQVTQTMDVALQANNTRGLMDVMRENQKLLTLIGVVPEKIRKFIAEVESIGGAAKVCGAGAVQGERAGAVMALADDEAALQAVCDAFSFSMVTICGETRGVHVL